MTGIMLGFKSPNNPPTSEAGQHASYRQFNSYPTTVYPVSTSQKQLPEHRERLFPPTETGMAIKEIWVYLLAYNLIRLLMVQATFTTETLPREISFKHGLQLWLIWSQKSDTLDDEQLYVLCCLMAQQRVGRIEPRAVKRRPKPYPLLTATRAQAREKVRQFGHPKKLK